MIWQDYVLFACSCSLLIPLVYARYHRQFVSTKMAIPTGIAVVGIGLTQLTLGLYMSAAVNILTGLLWFFLGKRS